MRSARAVPYLVVLFYRPCVPSAPRLLLLLQRPPLVDHSELTRFHSNDYISFLRTISPDNMHDHLRELQRCECSCGHHCRRRRCRDC